ncbi:MAG: hypothetical protein RJB13_675 [Pseudomonadota bacterium]|jgi:serine protease SohB
MLTFADWVQFSVSAAVVLLLLILVILLLTLILKKKKHNRVHSEFSIENLNKKWVATADHLRETILTSDQLKERLKAKKKEDPPRFEKNVFVLEFEGDVAASQCSTLKEQITAVISVAQKCDEVVIRIESPGGMVQSYGLAASQMARLRQRNIKVTACVDKVAASGGYMMACVADKIVAAPFAIIGSIGVVTGIPNLNKFLKKHDIDYVEQTAGESKRTVSLFGELTEEKKNKQQQQLNMIHSLFKKHVSQFRPSVQIDLVSTGEIWLASEALQFNLVDELLTSDDLLLKYAESANVYLLSADQPQDWKAKILKKFMGQINHLTRSLPFAQ